MSELYSVHKFNFSSLIFFLLPTEYPLCSGVKTSVCLVHFSEWVNFINMDTYFMLFFWWVCNIRHQLLIYCLCDSGSVLSSSTSSLVSLLWFSTFFYVLPWREQTRGGRSCLKASPEVAVRAVEVKAQLPTERKEGWCCTKGLVAQLLMIFPAIAWLEKTKSKEMQIALP